MEYFTAGVGSIKIIQCMQSQNFRLGLGTAFICPTLQRINRILIHAQNTDILDIYSEHKIQVYITSICNYSSIKLHFSLILFFTPKEHFDVSKHHQQGICISVFQQKAPRQTQGSNYQGARVWQLHSSAGGAKQHLSYTVRDQISSEHTPRHHSVSQNLWNSRENPPPESVPDSRAC